ncbi:MAG: response regulator [Candidatus Omnitrophota bacterium]
MIFASTFQEGIQRFKRIRNLDMVIIGLRLEDKSGLNFAQKVRKADGKVKFIMISAFGTAEMKLKARSLGVYHFLDKPLKVERLLGIINTDCS